ncbi:MAG TPA: hypothetical protein VMQ67_01370 [Candidatus Saccharimonadales bacterium]|nr:hypothetical protein [Candidatus Saccharimonadales bacterium]
MNPLSLLTKGRTIRGFKDRSCAYRLTIRGVAPNFSAGKKTSPTPSHPAPEVSQSTLFEQPQPPAAAPAAAPATAPAPKPPALAPQPVWRETAWNRLAGFYRGFLQR